MSRATRFTALAALALLVVLGLIGCSRSSGSKPATGSNLQADVDSLFQNYVDALNRADSTAALEAFAPQGDVTVAGREQFFRGPGPIGRTAGEGPLGLGQNSFDIDSLEVIPIEKSHALALVTYTVDPSDQDVPAFHTTGTYVLEKIGAKWRIMHAHICSAREM
jgi:hypothetical protein